MFKSSKFSIWPLYFAINELPLHKRWSSNNIILAGLWFGPQKPNMMTYLQPFNETISHLYSKGVEVYSSDIKSSFICHAMLLCGTYDLPAKAIVYNMTQFNVNHFAHKDMTICCDRLITFITANIIIKSYIPRTKDANLYSLYSNIIILIAFSKLVAVVTFCKL